MSQLDQINKFLIEVKEIIEPTKQQKKNIKERLDRARNKLEKEIPYIEGSDYSSKTYIHGSWKRRTLIRKSIDDRWDVDILAVLGACVPANHYSSTDESLRSPVSALQAIKKNLDNHYYQNRIRQDRPCITVEYQSDNFDLEIMPVFYGDPSAYRYDEIVVVVPNQDLTDWIRHFPFKFDGILTFYNQQFNNLLVPLIKLIKHWNNQNGKYLSGYHIELLTIYFFYNQELGNATLFDCIKFWFKMALLWIQKVETRPQYEDLSDPNESKFDYIYYGEDNIRSKLLDSINCVLNDLENDGTSITKYFPKI